MAMPTPKLELDSFEYSRYAIFYRREWFVSLLYGRAFSI